MLVSMSEMDLLGDLFGFVGFGDEDAATLADLGPLLSPSFDGILDEFHAAILRTPRAMAVFSEGEPQIQRQRFRLREWLEALFGGVYGPEYLERRARIGRVHVQMRLDQRYMFGAMNVVRHALHRELGVAAIDPPTEARGHVAIDRICDVELAIMLETYRDSYVEQQRSVERLATLGQLAASIGHELRNPLAVISTSTHLLRSRLGQDERLLRHVDKIARQIDVSERIIGDLLALAGDRRPQREHVDLVALVADVFESLPSTDNVTLRSEVHESLRSMWMDGGQLRQVLINLVTNAIQAVESQGGGEVQLHARLDEEQSLVIDVIDDGPGFPEGARDRVFEPLFTTKTGGIGLGLALCHTIIEKHGGTIRAADREEGGALLSLCVPNVLESA